MKYGTLCISLLFSGGIVFAQDNTEYKYEPEANKAEYFIDITRQGFR